MASGMKRMASITIRSACRRHDDADEGALGGRAHSAIRGAKCSNRRRSTNCPDSAPHGLVSAEPQDLYHQISMMETCKRRRARSSPAGDPDAARLLRVLHRLLDEREFLSPYGIRSLSAVYARTPLHAATWMARNAASVTIRANRRPGFSAAIRTGADRSGFR